MHTEHTCSINSQRCDERDAVLRGDADVVLRGDAICLTQKKSGNYFLIFERMLKCFRNPLSRKMSVSEHTKNN